MSYSMRPNCPSVIRYKVSFSDGSIIYPSLPGSANVSAVASQYAKETLTPKAGTEIHVVSIKMI